MLDSVLNSQQIQAHPMNDHRMAMTCQSNDAQHILLKRILSQIVVVDKKKRKRDELPIDAFNNLPASHMKPVLCAIDSMSASFPMKRNIGLLRSLYAYESFVKYLRGRNSIFQLSLSLPVPSKFNTATLH